MVIAGMVGYLILIVLYPEQFAARDWNDTTATKEDEAAAALKRFKLGGIHLGIFG